MLTYADVAQKGYALMQRAAEMARRVGGTMASHSISQHTSAYVSIRLIAARPALRFTSTSCFRAPINALRVELIISCDAAGESSILYSLTLNNLIIVLQNMGTLKCTRVL
jgi:hypothetical protein